MQHRAAARLSVALVLAVALAPIATTARAAGASSPPLEMQGAAPRPGLTPEEVVRIQLEALRANDAADAGIAVAFRFASPNNRRATGPLPRFGTMIKRGPYRLMLEYLTADFAPVERTGDQARQPVTLIGAGVSVTYVFHLSRQRGGECAGCWMTDAVTVEPFSGHAA